MWHPLVWYWVAAYRKSVAGLLAMCVVPMLRVAIWMISGLAKFGCLWPAMLLGKSLRGVTVFLILNIVIIVVGVLTMYPIEHFVGSMASFVDKCLCETFKTAAVANVLLEVRGSTFSYRLLLRPDEILKLLDLCFHPVKLLHVFLDVEVWEVILFANWLQSLRVGIGGNELCQAEIRLERDESGCMILS